MKTTFKVTWISLLSTIVTLLSHMLADANYHTVFVIKTPLFDIPYLFILVVLFIFLLLTLIFIGIKPFIPTSKLTKGLIYSNLIALIWIVFNLEPRATLSFFGFIVQILVIIIPLNIYGVFLGYLSSDKTYKHAFSFTYIGMIIILISWLAFRGLYYFIDVDARKTSDLLQTLVWLLGSSVVIGFVFTYLLNVIKQSFLIKLVWLFNIVAAVFIGYYLIAFSLDVVFYPTQYIKIFFDILSVMLGITLTMLIFEDKKKMVDPS